MKGTSGCETEKRHCVEPGRKFARELSENASGENDRGELSRKRMGKRLSGGFGMAPRDGRSYEIKMENFPEDVFSRVLTRLSHLGAYFAGNLFVISGGIVEVCTTF